MARTTRGGAPVPKRKSRPRWSAVVGPSAALAATLSGCASPSALRWHDATPEPAASAPASPTAAATPPRPPAAGDDGVVRTQAMSLPPAADPSGNPPPSIPAPAGEYPIDLSTALRLAEAENPLIAEARQNIGLTLAQRQSARALMLPTFNTGTSLHEHQGNLQRSSGVILPIDQQSLYVGSGARTVTAETIAIPGINIFSPITEAIFQPLAAQQRVERARFDARTTANNILLDVVDYHLELLAAEATLGFRRETALQGAETAKLTRGYAQAGQGRAADADRAATELSLLERDIPIAEEEVAVNAARLSQRLHLDQSVRLRPVSPSIEPITLIDPAVPLPLLVQTAVRQRPEVNAADAAIRAAERLYDQERYRPFLPTLWVGFSGGVFGGGSNYTAVNNGNYAGRTDFDARVYWTLNNFGLGNVAIIRQRKNEVGVAVGSRARSITEVRDQVASSYGVAISARQRVDITADQLRSAEAGYREDIDRIRNEVGRPLELVNSLRLLSRARVDRVRAITDYNKAEFRLFVAMGSPPPLDRPDTTPLPAAPIAAPVLPPVIEPRILFGPDNTTAPAPAPASPFIPITPPAAH